MSLLNSKHRLDLQSVRRKQQDKHQMRLETYEELLKKCHTSIYHSSELNIDNIFYRVPKFALGRPPIINHYACIAYMIHNLRRDGLEVHFIKPDVLFIVWKEQAVDGKALPPNVDRTAFQSEQPTRFRDAPPLAESPAKPTSKTTEQKLMDINRSIFRSVPPPDHSKTIYDDDTIQSLQNLANRIKKK